MFSRKKLKKRQRTIAAVLAFLLIGALILGAVLPVIVYGAETNPITITGQIGFGNKYKIGGTTPIHLEITNEGQDFRGEVQIKVLRQEYGNVLDYALYAKDLELPKDSTKQLTMNVYTDNMQRSFDILLMDGTKAVAKKTIYATAFPPEKGFLGVLSEDVESVNYLKDLKLDPASSEFVGNRFIELNEDIFPTELNVLKDFDAIIINNYDTTKLNQQQKEKLKQWVFNGGALILGTGPNASKVLKGLNLDFITVEDSQTTDLTDFVEMEQMGGKSFESSQPIQRASLKIEDGVDILFSGNFPITTYTTEGKGNIIIHYFDLGLNPIAQWDGNRYMLTELYMRHVPVFIQMNQEENNTYYGGNPHILRLFPRPQESNLVIWAFVLIGIYIIAAGPILYWILKIKDKREYGWFFIPIFALSFSGVIYFLSFHTTFRLPIGSSIGISTIRPGEITSKLDVTAGFFTPNTGENKITFAQDIHPRVSYVDDSQYYRYTGNDTEKKEVISAKIKTGNENELFFYNDQSWAMSTVQGTKNIKLEGPINGYITFHDNKMIGTIENQMGFDLKSCILAAGNNYYFLDEIKNKESINIEEEISFKTKGRYEVLDDIFGEVYNKKRMEEKWEDKLSKQDLQRMVQRREIFERYSDRNYTALQKTGGLYLNGTNMNEDSAIVLYGFNEQSFLDDIKINDMHIKNYNQNLFVIPLEIDYSKMDQVEIPYGFIRPNVEGSAGFYIDDYDHSIYVHGSGNLDFIYSVDKNIRLNEFQIQFTKSPNMTGTYIFNNNTGIWEELTTLPYKEDIGEYRNSEGDIQIRFEVQFDNQKEDRIEFPKFRMKGDKQ